MKSGHETIRVEYLLDPPPGSASHAANKRLANNSLARSLRPATEAEQQKIEEVRKMQAIIKGGISAGKSPSEGDTEDIRTDFAEDWHVQLMVWCLALDSMDQSVPIGGLVLL